MLSAGSGSEWQTIDDNGVILEYIQETTSIIVYEAMRPQKLPAIPSDAAVLAIYELWQEDLDSELAAADRPLLKAYTATLYKNNERYYLSIEWADDMANALEDFFVSSTLYTALDDTTGNYLTGLAQGNLAAADNGTSSAQGDEAEDYAAFYLAARSPVDYEGIASVSKNQKIEILSANDDTPVFTITDLNEIVEFLNNQKAEEWEHVGSIPANAEKICDIIRYAEERRTADKKLVEQYRDVLYQNTDGFFIEVDPLEGLCFQVPRQVGDYLKGFCNQPE